MPQRPLPTRNCLERLPNTLASIEAKAAEFAQAAFAEAIHPRTGRAVQAGHVPHGLQPIYDLQQEQGQQR